MTAHLAENPDELWDLTDRDGAPLGRTHRRGDPLPRGAFHLVTCVCAVRADGRVLLTRRAAGKTGWPLQWEFPGGSALSGETSAQAASRELGEETGVGAATADLSLLARHVEASALVDLFLTPAGRDVEVSIDPVEVAEHAWVELPEALTMLDRGEWADPWAARLHGRRSLLAERITELADRPGS